MVLEVLDLVLEVLELVHEVLGRQRPAAAAALHGGRTATDGYGRRRRTL